jgi:hypothetical protein
MEELTLPFPGRHRVLESVSVATILQLKGVTYFNFVTYST